MTEPVPAGAGLPGSDVDLGGADGAAKQSMRVVQRVVFPGADLDVVPLYVETNPERGAAELEGLARNVERELHGRAPELRRLAAAWAQARADLQVLAWRRRGG